MRYFILKYFWNLTIKNDENLIVICRLQILFLVLKESDVFKPFYQEKSNNRQGHVGLGLYITKTIIEKHGGKIKASNAEQGGAIVWMTIPLSKNK